MAAPGPGRRQAQQRVVMDQIKDHILDARLRPGDPLPTEAELERAVGASRTSVREAIRALTALDIVNVQHGRGTFVGELSLAALVENLVFRGLLNSADDHRMLEEVIDVRQGIEEGQAPRIVQYLTAEDLAVLGDLARHLSERAARREPYVDADREFHKRLLRPLGNGLIVQLTEAFWQVQARVTATMPVPEEDWQRTARAHSIIVDALAQKDLDALLAAIDTHYTPLRDRIRSLRAERESGRGMVNRRRPSREG